MDNRITKEQKLQRIIELEKKLGEIQDVDVLLERILTETRTIVHADAGSIYEVDGKNLRIKYAQNDTHLKELAPGEKLPYTAFAFPIDEKSVAGYVAFSGQPLNIPDAYQIPAEYPYKFNKETDKTTDYRTKSIYTIPLKMPDGVLLGVMQIINAQDDNGNVVAFDEDAELYITHFASSVKQALQNTFQTSLMVRRMLKMSEMRDPKETYPHVCRVSDCSVEIYDRWAFNHNIPEAEQHRFRDCLKIAAKFHDVGKVGVTDTILRSPVRFAPDSKERAILQEHTCIGAKIFEDGNSLLDMMCRDVALHHHETWDGNDAGYPGDVDFKNYKPGDANPHGAKVSGQAVPLAARIVAVADVFDALSHKRCYKAAWTFEDAFHEIQSSAGSHFDPEVVLAFMQVKDRICGIHLAYPDMD